MRTLGIVGGIGPESTIDYYRSLIQGWREQQTDGSYPSIIINSIDVKKMLDLVATRELAQLVEYLLDAVQRLAAAGADIALLAANTPHIVFDEIQQHSPIPLISIVETTRDAAKALGLARLGLFGTRFTMQGGFYQDVFSKAGLSLVLPETDEQEYIHDKYMTELIKGVFLDTTRERLLAIADRLKQRSLVQGIILGGTELPLILRPSPGIPFLDTTQIHVKAALVKLLP